MLVCTRRDAAAARAFFARALRYGPAPVEVTTDRAPVYPRVIEDAAPAARHVTDRYRIVVHVRCDDLLGEVQDIMAGTIGRCCLHRHQ